MIMCCIVDIICISNNKFCGEGIHSKQSPKTKSGNVQGTVINYNVVLNYYLF